jgi:hypothetical protein
MAADLGAPAVQLLGELVDRSLISVVEVDQRSRYVLLETIRQYALDRLVESEETEDATRRHAHWCLDFARRAAARAYGPAETGEIRRLVGEAANFRVAISWALDKGEHQVAIELLLALEDLVYISSSIAELVGPVVAGGAVAGHPDEHRLLAMELIRRAISDGSADRAPLAEQLAAVVHDDSPDVTLLIVLLIASALGVYHDASISDRLLARADRSVDPHERARLTVAALIVQAYIGTDEGFDQLLARALRIADEQGMKRLAVAVGSMACLQGLRGSNPAAALVTAEPTLRHLDELPSPSIMASGLITMFTEAAVRAGAPTATLFAAARRLRPVLHGDFDRLGLALARLVERNGDIELAVRALGACTATQRSGFSSDQREIILRHAVAELGDDAVGRLLATGQHQERSDLYREMWAVLAPQMQVEHT